MDQSLLKKMVWENDFQSLCDCIERTIIKFDTILLWQPESEIVKKKHEAFIQKFSKEKGILQLIEVAQENFNFDENEEIYIHFKDRSLLFKANIRKLSTDKIQVLIPKKFKIIEYRDTTRSNLLDQDLKVQIDLDVQHRTKNSTFSLNIQDLSHNGIGLIFSVSKINYFKVGDILKISKFGDISLDDKIRCEIMHITKIDNHVELITNRDYKLGLKFLDEVPFFINSYEY